jgi:ribosome-binding factor A
MGRRLLRVNEAVREVLSAAVAKGLKDPRVGFVTITGVETSPDLAHAKVFVSVLGGRKERDATLAGLRSSHGYLQDRLSASLRLRRTPQLDFIYDETTDKAMRIERILQRYEGEIGPADGERFADDQSAAGGSAAGGADDGAGQEATQ